MRSRDGRFLLLKTVTDVVAKDLWQIDKNQHLNFLSCLLCAIVRDGIITYYDMTIIKVRTIYKYIYKVNIRPIYLTFEIS